MMVRLTVDIIARATSGHNKRKREESVQQYLKRLTHLYLEERNIDEIGEDFGLCRNLMALYLYDNKLRKIPSLHGNSNLTHLYLQNNCISKIQGLGTLTKLTKLYIGGNCIAVIEGLEKLNQLQELYIENQKLPDGEKLLFDPRSLVGLMRSLQILNISGNNLDSIRDLQCLAMLTQLMANDNELFDIKELAQLFGSWHYLCKLELSGNPVCNKAKYRDRIIIMIPRLEIFDGREITETAKVFLKNWQAKREAQKRKREAMTRDGTGFSSFPNGAENHPIYHTHSAASRLGNDVPGYIMPALPRKQFQEVLARSASLPNSTTPGSHGMMFTKNGLDMSQRYTSNLTGHYTEANGVTHPSSATHKLSLIQMGSGAEAGDAMPHQIV